MSAAAGGGVLAVMQASADQLWRYRRDILAREEEAARAAVAELIENHKWALDLLEEQGLSELSLMAQHKHEACRAALSNIEGASHG